MSDSPADRSFLSQLNSIVESNIADEQFGVSELADLMNMSRSNLLRKVKKETNLSVSQLISQVRLKKAMELLKTTQLNVSEVSHEVGFSSTSYFIKCFREHFGYPPGEVNKRSVSESPDSESTEPSSIPYSSNTKKFLIGGAAALFICIGAFFGYTNLNQPTDPIEKSIAVLPFKNDSNDSSNVYLINGLMESTLTNLQQINDLKVLSRTSSEKYRNTTKSVPEMAKELNVSYFIEGSGQKIGNEILVNIQLIEAATDRHLWAKQYKREVKDIFSLQQEIAKNIAREIEVVITPDEKRKIEKVPTDDVVAYDLFLKGRDLFNMGTHEEIMAAIPYYKQAIDRDPDFALAYAEIAMVYYYLDLFQKDKKYETEINSFADKALLIDPKLANAWAAKGLFYIYTKDYESAGQYLEKALALEPNSYVVVNFLADLYNNYLPNTGKYLEYALRGVKLGIAGNDSSATSITYLHLGNALLQTGFLNEALKMIDKSLTYNPHNQYADWVRIFNLYALDGNLERTRQMLINKFEKDTTQLHILEEIGKVCYMQRDFAAAHRYYEWFTREQEKRQLDLYQYEHLKFAISYAKAGHEKEAKQFAQSFKEFADNDKSMYKSLNLAGYYCYTGDHKRAIEQLKIFSEEDNFQYWVLLLKHDPIVDPVKDLPEFKVIMAKIEKQFWDNHKSLRSKLEENGLI